MIVVLLAFLMGIVAGLKWITDKPEAIEDILVAEA
jgi:hypothetical protein